MSFLTGCSNGEEIVENVDDKTTVRVEGNYVIVTPEKYNKAFRNPMMGWRDVFSVGLDPIPNNYPLPYGSIYKEYIPWDKIEDKASDGVEKIISYSNHRWGGIEDKNIKVIPRVYIHWLGTPPVNDPDKLDGIRFPSDIPYCCDEDEYPKTDGYFHSNFQARVAALVEKMGEAWDNDPRVAYVEMGIIGQWGEQHSPSINTYWKPHTYPEHIANETWIPGIEKTLGDAFSESFKNKKVMVRYAYDFKDYEFGYYWDSWGIAEEDVRGYEEMMKMGDRWKAQPYGGEICWNWGDFSKFESLTDVLANKQTQTKIINQIRKLHANHLGYFSYARPTVDFSKTDLLANAQAVQKALGYHFTLNEFKYEKRIEKDKSFNISFKVQNIGSSPFYYDWPIEISLLNKETKEVVWRRNFDDIQISRWMPGENWDSESGKYIKEPEIYEVNKNIIVDEELPSDKYIISLAILDPAGLLPSLRISTKNYFTGGRHPMGYVGFEKNISEYEINSKEFDDIFYDLTLRYNVE
tara:strand:+ start:9845 stop:11407 length:1563 start_codon:yes stop_codon:yes gene_type:complete